MPDYFLHGVEVVEIDNGPRPIRTVRSSVIGLIGTAPDLDAASMPSSFSDIDSWTAAKATFPLNTPVLIAGSRREAAKLGATGTLPVAMDGIFDQIGAMVVVVRVAEGADADETMANIIGGTDASTGQFEGVQAFIGQYKGLFLLDGLQGHLGGHNGH